MGLVLTRTPGQSLYLGHVTMTYLREENSGFVLRFLCYTPVKVWLQGSIHRPPPALSQILNARLADQLQVEGTCGIQIIRHNRQGESEIQLLLKGDRRIEFWKTEIPGIRQRCEARPPPPEWEPPQEVKAPGEDSRVPFPAL